MTQKQADIISEYGTNQAQRLAPEVLPKAKRRNYTASYKLWVLEEADKCRQQPGQIGPKSEVESAASAQHDLCFQPPLRRVRGHTSPPPMKSGQ